MSFEKDDPNLDYVLGEFGDAVVGIKHALADGHFEPKEVVDVLRSIDPALADYIGKLLAALSGMYKEVGKLSSKGPFVMLMEVGPYLATKLMRIFQ
jgi:hypothetical protein